MILNKELQLDPHPCYDWSTIEGESDLWMNRNIRHTRGDPINLLRNHTSYPLTLCNNPSCPFTLVLWCETLQWTSTLHGWISTQPPIQRPHSDHWDTTRDATSDNLTSFLHSKWSFSVCAKCQLAKIYRHVPLSRKYWTNLETLIIPTSTIIKLTQWPCTTEE